jgi:hypothetical protein
MHPIPNNALDDRLGFLGTSGSGKTYNAGGAVERLLERRARVVIIDPLGVWWGLRLTADGKHPSPYNVVIFGGPRGDLPLTEHAGALIGETAAIIAESCIIDLSEMRGHSAERRFMTAFLETIYRKAAGEPFHLIVDEADLFAPQKPQGGQEVLLGHMENIVRRGRVLGFIPWLISQRPAVLNKNVLSQVDGLIAFKLTSTQDRDALDAWIEGQADKAKGKEIKDSLPVMSVGQGIVWLPGHGILKTVQFPPKVTFDSSRTPKRGEKQKRAKTLKPLDVGVLKGRLASVEAEAKANDPKALRSEVAALKAEKVKLEKQVTTASEAKKPPDKDALKKIEQRAIEQAKKHFAPLLTALEAAMKFIVEINAKGFFKAGGDAVDKDAVEKAIKEAAQQVTRLVEGHLSRHDKRLDALRVEAERLAARIKSAIEKSGEDVNIAVNVTHNEPFTVQPGKSSAAVVPRPAVARPSAAASGDGTYSRPQMKVLRALAMWKAIGHDRPSREMVAAAAGYSPSSGGFNNLLGGLGPKALGVIGIPAAGNVSLEIDGIDVPTIDEGRDMLLDVLSRPQRRLVAALNGAGAITRDQLGEATGYSASSGGFNNLIGSLNTLGITYVPQQSHVSLSDWAQELLSGYTMDVAA